MKKIIIILLALVMVLSLAACGGKPAETTKAPAAETKAPEAETKAPDKPAESSAYDPNASLDFEMKTSQTNTIVHSGEADKTLYSTPILVTSFGQSTDAAMIGNVLKQKKISYTFDAQAKADVVKNYKTVIIAVGASTKGLGQAGINESDEIARAKDFMEAVKTNGTQVIFVHIGGSERRGTTSDTLADMVLAQCSYMVVKEDANFDYKFTKYAEEHNLPLTLVYATKDTLEVFGSLLN